ncbi:hypothetical protein ElyMa_001614300 [Elysia marginata]|uniref:Uncharacterized protein n=1 Tax=Elysia marginata TaxID=1093978 RepID=A0AAV4JLS0_9GAST|nr:hypothetical protein ElyMa_001614300 [Elysia marginata]
MASKKIIYGIGALGTAAVTSTAIAVPLSLRKSGKKSPYQSLLVGTKLNANQLTELKKQAVVTNATAGDIKQAYINNDKLAVEYDKSGVKTIVVFKLSENKLLTIASSLSGKQYVVSYETGTAKVLQLSKGSKEQDVKDNAKTFKAVIDDAISAAPTALADIKDNEDIIPSGQGTSTTSGVTTGAPTATATFK